jgi:amino acid transporter
VIGGLSKDFLTQYLNPTMLGGGIVGIFATVIFYGMTTTFGTESYLGQLFLTTAKGAVEEALEHLGFDNNQKKALSSAIKNSGKLYAKGNDNSLDYVSGILSAMVSAVTIPSIKYLANSLNSVGTLKLILPACIAPGSLVYFGIAFFVVSHIGYKLYQTIPPEEITLSEEVQSMMLEKEKDSRNIFYECYEKVQDTYKNSTVSLTTLEKHLQN